MPFDNDALGIINTSVVEKQNDSLFDETDQHIPSTTTTTLLPISNTPPPPSTSTTLAPLSDEKVNDELFEGEGDENDDGEKEKKEGKQGDNAVNWEGLSQSLYTLGIFSPQLNENGENEISVAHSDEEFKQLWEQQKADALNESLTNYITLHHGEEGLRVFEAIFQNGVNPKEFYKGYNELADLNGLDLENNESDQEAVIREYYKDKLPKDKLDAKIKRLKDLAELQTESELLLPELISAKEKNLSDKENAEKERILSEKRTEDVQKSSLNKLLSEKITAKEVDGFPLSPEIAKKMYSFITEKNFINQNTGEKLTGLDVALLKINKDPSKLLTKLKLALLAENDFDFSKIEKRAKSKDTAILFKELQNKKQITQKEGHSTASPVNTNASSWNEFLKTKKS